MFGRRYYNYKFRLISGLIIGVIMLINTGFVEYKQETLTCNLEENTCKVKRVNYFNNKEILYLTRPYDITDIIVIEKQRKKHRKSKYYYYSVYFVSFIDVNNNRLYVFCSEYKDKSAAQNMADKVKKELLSGKNEIEINRR